MRFETDSFLHRLATARHSNQSRQTRYNRWGRIRATRGRFRDFAALAEAVWTAVPLLVAVVGIPFYPTPAAAASYRRWRPVGLGLMGLQDVFFRLGLPFDAPEARALPSWS